MKFYSVYNYPESKVEPKCPKTQPELVFNSATGEIEKLGEIPFYEEIQSHADSCRLDKKLEQFRLGNTFALGVPGGEYGDFSTQPTNLAQVLQSRDSAKQQFEQLPQGIRAIFGDSYTEFAQSLQDGTYTGKIERYAAEQLKQLSGTAQSGSISESGATT